MDLKFTFLTLCISVAFILILTILKKNLIDLTEKKFKYLHHVSSINQNIFLNTKFVIEPKCGSSFIVWIVTSSAENSLQRLVARRAYTVEELKSLNVIRLFLLGLPTKEDKQKSILEESQKYNDVLQGDFLENYRNLTLKHLMGLRWASANCTASFLIKTDDDIVLNIFDILKLLQEKAIKENTMAGYVLRKMKPMRIVNNKWFVTKEEYPGEIYPDFLSGWFYITNLNLVQLLISKSKQFPNFFWIDDVYITGILREESGIKVEELNSFYATDYRYLECCIRGKRKKLKCEFIVGPDGGKKELHIKFKQFSEFCQWNCSKKMKNQLVSETCVSAYEENVNIENPKVQVLRI